MILLTCATIPKIFVLARFVGVNPRERFGLVSLIPVKEMIVLYGGETTVDHVRAKARCSSCGQKTFEFRIVYCGASYDALMGAANTKMDVED